jgi:hypothetical protein
VSRHVRARRRRSLIAALCLVAAAASAHGQQQEIHGADSVFASPELTIVWAVLRGAAEEQSVVVVRIVNTLGRYAYVSVDGSDPFTRRRAPIVKDLVLRDQVDVRSSRQSFAEYPRREIHLYRRAGDWGAGKPDLTVYYLGVPDSTPEFASEARLLSYLATAASRAR